MSFIAGYLLGLEEGGGGQSEEKYDHIAGLPTVFAFDMVDGWSCEVCVDEGQLSDRGRRISNDYGGWSEEFPYTLKSSKDIRLHYLRILKNSEIMFISDVFSSDGYSEWYASNGSIIGDIMKTVKVEYSDFYVKYVQGKNEQNELALPYITLGCTYTDTTNGVSTVSETTRTVLSSSNTKYICKNDPDLNLYIEFVKAVRKFSDEFNAKE